MLLQFERRREALLSTKAFVRRMLAHGGAALLIMGVSLFAGVLGYHVSERMGWLQALLNASMILGGMGPVDALHTRAGKIFASCYALFSGAMFLVIAGVLFAPLVHRFLHRFHLEVSEQGDGK